MVHKSISYATLLLKVVSSQSAMKHGAKLCQGWAEFWAPGGHANWAPANFGRGHNSGPRWAWAAQLCLTSNQYRSLTTDGLPIWVLLQPIWSVITDELLPILVGEPLVLYRISATRRQLFILVKTMPTFAKCESQPVPRRSGTVNSGLQSAWSVLTYRSEIFSCLWNLIRKFTH